MMLKTKRLSREDRKRKALERCCEWLKIVSNHERKRKHSNTVRKSFKMLADKYGLGFRVLTLRDDVSNAITKEVTVFSYRRITCEN